MTIKAPYNFVPLNDKVIFPDWQSQANHDIPFSDGKSGIITIKIEAKSPIYVRDGHSDKNQPPVEFSHFKDILKNKDSSEKRYFIPGTSIKGCIRNVLEILSFSSMTQIDDNKYTFRDLSDSKNDYLTEFRENKPLCGWLSEDDEGNWFIENCGKPKRISHKSLDDEYGAEDDEYGTYLNEKFEDVFKQALTDEKKSASYKYDLFIDQTTGQDLNRTKQFTDDGYSNGRPLVKFDTSGSLEGTIVFTGQPSPRNETTNPPSGKHLEFVFLTSATKKLMPVPNTDNDPVKKVIKNIQMKIMKL